MSSIKEVFESHCPDLKVDRKFISRIADLEARFVNKKQDHIEFFGGTLTGVHVVRFTTEDFDVIYNDILDVDEISLTKDVHNLPDINPAFAVSSDIFAISCVWIMYKITQSKYLNDQQKHDGLLHICLYLNYRYLTSLLFKYFKYPANPDTARATYAQLSNRFGLKTYGSWSALIRQRSEDVISQEGIHYKKFSKLDNDYDVVIMLNDVKGRINDIIKNIYEVFMRVHAQGSKITSSTALVELDGEIILKDKVRGQENYTLYIHRVVADKASFYKQELVDNICRVVTTAPDHLVKRLIEWVPSNYAHMNNAQVDTLLDKIMEHAFSYLSENRGLLRSHQDIIEVMSKMRGTYTNSRQSSTLLAEIKDSAEVMISKALAIKGESLLASLRTAFCLYVILRAFTMHYYNSQ